MTIELPVWVLLTLMFLVVTWQIAVTVQVRFLRDLFREYWRLTYGGEDSDVANRPDPS